MTLERIPVKWLLNILYATALLIISPVILWRMLRHRRYLDGWREKLLGQLPRSVAQRHPVWFHAVSVGEVIQLEKVVRAFITATGGQVEVLVTTSTDTGYQLARERLADITVSWLPLDFSWAVSQALERVRPQMLVLMELELWPNLLWECRHRGVPTALINARMSDRSFRGYGQLPFLQPLFQSFSVVAAQTEQYADRLRRLGAREEHVKVSGSIKFDSLQTDRDNPATNDLRALLGITSDATVLIAGSTQAPEERMAVQAWRALQNQNVNARLIIVPRHRERFDHVAAEISSTGVRVTRRSEIKKHGVPPADSVIVLDTIGELAACWGMADVAFVGGSFGPRNGQNMLEPAAYGAAVVVGPRTSNFRDIVALLKDTNAIVQVADPGEFHEQVIRLMSDAAARATIGMQAANTVAKQQNALSATVRLLTGVLATNQPLRSAA